MQTPGIQLGSGGSRNMAAWLLRYEAEDSEAPGEVLGAAERTVQKLSGRLAKLVTAAGCKPLVARAIHLAQPEAPFLRGVTAGLFPGPCLEGLDESSQGIAPEMLESGMIAVIAQLLGLLALFIGEVVTMRLVRDVWSDAALESAWADPPRSDNSHD